MVAPSSRGVDPLATLTSTATASPAAVRNSRIAWLPVFIFSRSVVSAVRFPSAPVPALPARRVAGTPSNLPYLRRRPTGREARKVPASGAARPTAFDLWIVDSRFSDQSARLTLKIFRLVRCKRDLVGRRRRASSAGRYRSTTVLRSSASPCPARTRLPPARGRSPDSAMRPGLVQDIDAVDMVFAGQCVDRHFRRGRP